MYDFECSFESFDVIIEDVKKDNEEVYVYVKDIEKKLKQLIEDIEAEIDNMYDDYEDDHDNYDSIYRENRLLKWKDSVKYLKRRINEILYENDIDYVYLY